MRLLVPALFTVLLAACGGDADVGPEDEIRAWVAQAESAAEEKDRGDDGAGRQGEPCSDRPLNVDVWGRMWHQCLL